MAGATPAVFRHDVAKALYDSYHIVALDNRDNGESEVPKNGYTLRHYADDLAELIPVLGMERPYFTGNSWGVNIDTYLVADRPELLSAVNRSLAFECDAYLTRIAIPTLALVADSEAGRYISPEELEHHRKRASAYVVFRRWERIGRMIHGQQPDLFLGELWRYFGH